MTDGGLTHGFTGAMYRRVGDNRIEVTDTEGRIGLFDGEGRWIEGEIYEADPQMCVWLAADRIKSSHRLSAQDGPGQLDTN